MLGTRTAAFGHKGGAELSMGQREAVEADAFFPPQFPCVSPAQREQSSYVHVTT